MKKSAYLKLTCNDTRKVIQDFEGNDQASQNLKVCKLNFVYMNYLIT